MKKRKKSIGTTEQSSPIIVKSGGSTGVVVPIIAIGGLGVLGYFGYKAWDKKSTEAAISEANANSLKHDLSIKKTMQKINETETQKGFVSGVNSFGKKVTINIFTQVKETISQFYVVYTDKYGLNKYVPISKENINQSAVKNSFFDVPVLHVQLFAKVYNIYTGKSFIDDAQKLSPNLYAQIKAIFGVANKQKKGVKGLGKVLTVTQKSLL